MIVQGLALTIGRDPTCDRVVDFPVVSFHHARIVRDQDQLLVVDLGSSNGTFLNGVKITRTAIARSGDILGLGSYELRLVDGELADRVAVEPTDTAGTSRFTTPVDEDTESVKTSVAPVSGRWLTVAGVALGAANWRRRGRDLARGRACAGDRVVRHGGRGGLVWRHGRFV